LPQPITYFTSHAGTDATTRLDALIDYVKAYGGPISAGVVSRITRLN
jgi:hypothetical protein